MLGGLPWRGPVRLSFCLLCSSCAWHPCLFMVSCRSFFKYVTGRFLVVSGLRCCGVFTCCVMLAKKDHPLGPTCESLGQVHGARTGRQRRSHRHHRCARSPRRVLDLSKAPGVSPPFGGRSEACSEPQQRNGTPGLAPALEGSTNEVHADFLDETRG